MVPLGDAAQVEARFKIGDLGLVESHFFPFGDSVSVGARLVHGLR